MTEFPKRDETEERVASFFKAVAYGAIGVTALLIMLAGLIYPAKAGETEYQEMFKPTVQINENCSATVIRSGMVDGVAQTHVLTAKHCVSGNEGVLNIKQQDNEGKIVYETRAYYDVLRKAYGPDLALLELRDPVHIYPAAKVAERLQVTTGDDVWAVGYPLGLFKIMTKGVFTDTIQKPFGKSEDYYITSTDVTFGNSGGGLYQKVDGHFELIGVTSWKVKENHFMNGFVTLDDIHDFLGIGAKKYKIEVFSPWL